MGKVFPHILRLTPPWNKLIVSVVLLVCYLCACHGELDDTERLYSECHVEFTGIMLESCGEKYLSRDVLKHRVLGGWYACWMKSYQASAHLPLRILVPDVYASWLLPTLERFSSEYSVPLQFNIQPMDQLLTAMLADAQLPPEQQHAVWLQSSVTTQHLADVGMLMDLSHLVDLQDSGLHWSGILQLFRLQLATYQRNTFSVPLDGSTLYTFSRRDVMKALGLRVPISWQALLDFFVTYPAARAAALATAATSDSSSNSSSPVLPDLPPYAICIPQDFSCSYLTLLQAIWSSLAQTQGSAQGVHFDPVSLKPQLDSPAAREAFRLLAALLAASAPPETGEGCSYGALGFARGRCVLALGGFAAQLRLVILPEFNATVLQTDIEVSPLPGSEQVWVRDKGNNLLSCTLDICPYATAYNSSVTATAAAAAGGQATQQQTSGGGNGSVLVNHAPTSPGGNLQGAVNNGVPLVARYLAYEVLAYLGSPNRLTVSEPAPSPLTVMAPVREELVTADATTLWQAAGYNRDLYLRSQLAISFSRRHTNRAWDLRMPYHMTYYDVLKQIVMGIKIGSIFTGEQQQQQQQQLSQMVPQPIAETTSGAPLLPSTEGSAGSMDSHGRRSPNALAYRGNSSPRMLDVALQEGQARLVEYYVPEVYRGKYFNSLEVHAVDVSGGSSSRSVALGSLLGPLLGSLVLSAAAFIILALWRRRHSRQGTGGSNRAPWLMGSGSEAAEANRTSAIALLVTDIQDSTSLWEALPAAVMSEAIRMHHAAVRHLLVSHGGYESSTEGDSFILAFRSVKQAVMFALDLQTQLLLLPWPQELLEQEVCRPVFVDIDGFPFTSGLGRTAAERSRNTLDITCRSLLSPSSHPLPQPRTPAVEDSSRSNSRHRSPFSTTAAVALSVAASGVQNSTSLAGGSMRRLFQGDQLRAHACMAALRGEGRASGWDVCEGRAFASHLHHGSLPSQGAGTPLAVGLSTPSGSWKRAPSCLQIPSAMLSTPAADAAAPATSSSPRPETAGALPWVSESSGARRLAPPPPLPPLPSQSSPIPREMPFNQMPASGYAFTAPGDESLSTVPRAPALDIAYIEGADGDRHEGTTPSGATPSRPDHRPMGHHPVRDAHNFLAASLPTQLSLKVAACEYPCPQSAESGSGRGSPPPPASPPASSAPAQRASTTGPPSAPEPSRAHADKCPRASVGALHRNQTDMGGMARANSQRHRMEAKSDVTAADGGGGGNEGGGGGGEGGEGEGGEGEGGGPGQGRVVMELSSAELKAARVPTLRFPSFIDMSRRQALGQLKSARVLTTHPPTTYDDDASSNSSGAGGDGLALDSMEVVLPAAAVGSTATKHLATVPTAAQPLPLGSQSPRQSSAPAEERLTLGEVMRWAAVTGTRRMGPVRGPLRDGSTSGFASISAGMGGGASWAANCVFRGLRVRMGISWVQPSQGELQYNAAAARMVYGGPCVAACKAVADLAHGGQVVMGDAARERLEVECGSGPGGGPSGMMILLLGTYAFARPSSAPHRAPRTVPSFSAAATAAISAAAVASLYIPGVTSNGCGRGGVWADDSSFGGYLQSAPTVIDSGAFSSGTIASAAAAAAVPIAEQRSFYCLTTHTLAPRLALIPPLRMPPEAVPCNVLYDAPVGRVSYVVVQVPAAAALMAWQRDVAEAALRLFHAVADAGLRRLLGPQRRQQQGGGEGAACMGQRAEGAESPGPINIYKVPTASGVERGRVCVAFSSPLAAVRWAEGFRLELLEAPWPQELLAHELCGVVEISAASYDPRMATNCCKSSTSANPLSAFSKRPRRSKRPTRVAFPVPSDPNLGAPQPDLQTCNVIHRRSGKTTRGATTLGGVAASVGCNESPLGGPGARASSGRMAAFLSMLRQESGGTRSRRDSVTDQGLAVAMMAAGETGGRVGGGSGVADRVSARRGVVEGFSSRRSFQESNVGPEELGAGMVMSECRATKGGLESRVELMVVMKSVLGGGSGSGGGGGGEEGGVLQEGCDIEGCQLSAAEIEKRLRSAQAQLQARGPWHAGEAADLTPASWPSETQYSSSARSNTSRGEMGTTAGGGGGERGGGVTTEPASSAAPAPTPAPAISEDASLDLMQPLLLLRGLRIRAGVATGLVEWHISESTHALTYSGRPITAATKLVSSACSGQVLCDEGTRLEAVDEQIAEVEEHKERELQPASQAAVEGGPAQGGGGGGRGGEGTVLAPRSQLPPMVVFTAQGGGGGGGGSAVLRHRVREAAYVCSFLNISDERSRKLREEVDEYTPPPGPSGVVNHQCGAAARPWSYPHRHHHHRASTVEGIARPITMHPAAGAPGAGPPLSRPGATLSYTATQEALCKQHGHGHAHGHGAAWEGPRALRTSFSVEAGRTWNGGRYSSTTSAAAVATTTARPVRGWEG